MSTTIKQRVISNGLISEPFKKINNRLQVINCFNACSPLFILWEYKFSVLVNRNYTTQGAFEQRKSTSSRNASLQQGSRKITQGNHVNVLWVPVFKGTGGVGWSLLNQRWTSISSRGE